MKQSSIFILVVSLVMVMACKTRITSKPTTLVELNQHLNVALETDSVALLLSLINEDYKNEQIAFLQGDTAQFLNELFCGYKMDREYACPGIDNIKMIIFSKPGTPDSDNAMNFDITIQLDNGEILIGGVLSAVRKNGVLTIVGAVG